MAKYSRGYSKSFSSSSSRSGGFKTRTNSSGYRQYNSGSGWNLTHRTVAAKKVGGSIGAGREVHHINGNKTDNRPSNLSVLSKLAHSLIHKN